MSGKFYIENFIALKSHLEKFAFSSVMGIVLLDFYASWCTACIKMDREVWTNPEVKSLLKYFILLRVDLTKINLDSISLARKFNIIGPPDIIFFDPEGTEIKTRIVGFVNAQQLALYLQSVLENHRQ